MRNKLLILALLPLFLVLQAPAQGTIKDFVGSAQTFDGVGDSIVATGNGYGTAGFQITGTWDGTITFSGSINGTTWVAIRAWDSDDATSATEATANGIYFVSTAGLRYVKALMTVRNSGSATVQSIATDDAGLIASLGAAGGGGGGAEGTVDLTGINGVTPSTGNGTAGTGTLRVAIASNNTAFSVNASATGPAAHDAAASGNPVITGGVASAAAPTSVSADGDAVQGWYLRNGAQATVLTAAGSLVGGDATNGLDVDVTRLPALVAGTANIGDVDVLTVPTDPFGANADAASATGSISAKLRFIAATGIPVTSISAGNNNIGDVDVASIAAGNNNIGDVDIASGPTGASALQVQGAAAHDAAVAGGPVLEGGYASAAAPSDVSADGDAVRGWRLRNGAAATVLTAAGALIGGDATNGIDADVTRAFGQAAHDAAISGAPFRIGLRAATADYTAVATGDQADALGTIDGKQVVKPHAIRAATWNYAAATGGITNTTAVTVKTAAGAGVRNCVTSIQVINQHATVSTETMLVDGAGGTVLHRGWAQAAGGGYAVNFDVPLCGTANTLLEVDNVTTGSAVLYNVQGYTTQE